MVLTLNIFLLITVTIKLRRFNNLKSEYLSIQKNVEELLNENTYTSNLFLDNLEEKIAEGEKVIERITNLTQYQRTIHEENKETKYIGKKISDPVSSEINRLLHEGKTILEIAEKLNTTQGEVALRLNLGNKTAH
jgi:DNA-binding NarL/FixJ family response regulator